ncbi:c-type cytochrome [Pandoraea pneumonica]|uniref:c-type cytochrome n=1 Tax=Pandoraea pneumonica TaxID=2508299 RepID=UPI003CE71B05
MKRFLGILLGLTVAVPAFAQVDAAKATSIESKNMCFSCHAADHKIVGPAYREVAEK